MSKKKRTVAQIFFVVSALILCSCSGLIKSVSGTERGLLTILALGDSYTVGEGVENYERWPIQLRDSLNAKGFRVSWVDIVAKTGWTTDELDLGMNEINPKARYDIVTLLIGVNNQYRGRSVEEYSAQFTRLLHRAAIFTNGNYRRLIVLSIPDWGITPFANDRGRKKISEEIDTYNDVKRQVCNSRKVKYINITDISRKAEIDSTLLAEDGLHPSGKMYSQWVSRILPDLIKMLGE